MSRSRGSTWSIGGAGERDGAAGGQLEAGEHAQHRRLAAARRPEEHEELAVGDLEVEGVDRGDVAEALRDRLEADPCHPPARYAACDPGGRYGRTPPRPRARALARLDPGRRAPQGPPRRRLRGAGGVHGRRAGRRLRHRLPGPALRRRAHAHRRHRPRHGAGRHPPGQPRRRPPAADLRAVPARDPRRPGQRGAAVRRGGLRARRGGAPLPGPARRGHQRGAGGRGARPRSPTSSPSPCCARAPRSRSTSRAPTSRCWPTPSARSGSSSARW